MRNHRWDAFVERAMKDYDTIPHCDSRILHAPGECAYCDGRPEWQQERLRMCIAFTGHAPLPGQDPCPADESRPPNSPADHRRWAGNKPTTATGDPSWPAESFASLVVYGDKGGRAPWPLAERLVRRATAPLRRLRMRLRGWRLTDDGMFWTHS